MAVATKSLYDVDFAEWAFEVANLLRERRFDEVDWATVIEEIDDLAKNQHSAVRSQLWRMLLHLIKIAIQPQKESASWRHSIADAQDKLQRKCTTSPSLVRALETDLQKIYERSIVGALYETGIEGTARS